MEVIHLMKAEKTNIARITGENRALIAGILIAAAIELPMALVAHEPGLGAVAAVVALLTSVVVDLVIRVRQNQEEIREMWETEKVLFKLGEIGNILRSIIDNAELTESKNNPYFSNTLQIALKRTAGEIERLARGHIFVEGDSYFDMLMAFTNRARLKIVATSVVTTSAWWNTDLGRQYRAANIAAVKRNVSITRIFILKNEASVTVDDIKEMQAQHEGGIDIRVAYADRLKDESLVKDTAVYDGEIIVQLEFVPRTATALGCHFYDTTYSDFIGLQSVLQKLCQPSNSVRFEIEKEHKGW